MKRTWPNLITLLRLIAVPIFGVVLIVQQQFISALLIFWIAGISDLVDGWLARKTNTVSALGQIGDPIADKALTGVAWVGLSVLGLIPWWATLIILIREVGITLWRLTLIHSTVLAADKGGKTKTAIQIAVISLVLMNQELNLGLVNVFLQIMIPLAVVVTVLTALNYILSYRRMSD
jgi:CDP-diacylglycerol--glycerol-3-phosphate 3-phosphatidyltransferase